MSAPQTRDWLAPCTLSGVHVRLVPLRRAHAQALVNAASDGKLWQLWFTSVPSAGSIDAYLDSALADAEAGFAMPLVVIDRTSDEVIGASRFCNAQAGQRRMEIGYTWYARRYQRSAVNSECKLLMLSQAFETWQAIAVEFRTHWHNQRSRAAIARLGAKQDGVLRNHSRDPDGCFRDTVVFSILNSEWPTVKKSLQFQLQHSR